MAKGKIKEIIDYAKHSGDIDQYKVKYREFDKYIIVSLVDFLSKGDEFAGIIEGAIPYHRIICIYKNDKIIFERPPPS